MIIRRRRTKRFRCDLDRNAILRPFTVRGFQVSERHPVYDITYFGSKIGKVIIFDLPAVVSVFDHAECRIGVLNWRRGRKPKFRKFAANVRSVMLRRAFKAALPAVMES